MFPYFTLFGKTVGLYAVCAAVGIFVCAAFATVCLKKIKLAFEDVVLLTLVIMAGVLIGGHLLYAATKYKMLFMGLPQVRSAKALWSLLLYCFGGAVYYGGFIGMWTAVSFYLRRKRFENAPYIRDVVAMCVPLFHAFGRIGCFMGGCCYGIEYAFGFTVHGNTLTPEINDVSRFPTPLLESAFNLLIFFLLYYLFKKGRAEGRLVLIYMLVYPVIRFCDEFLRGDAVRGFIGPLSTSQWISVILFVFAVVQLVMIYRKKDAALSEKNNA